MDTENAGRISEPKDINIIMAAVMADIAARKGGEIEKQGNGNKDGGKQTD